MIVEIVLAFCRNVYLKDMRGASCVRIRDVRQNPPEKHPWMLFEQRIYAKITVSFVQ